MPNDIWQYFFAKRLNFLCFFIRFHLLPGKFIQIPRFCPLIEPSFSALDTMDFTIGRHESSIYFRASAKPE